MTLEKTKDAFITWINSCKTEEQLRLLEHISNEFVVKRFSEKGDFLGTIPISAEIANAIYRQKEKIIIENNALTPISDYDQDQSKGFS